MAGCLLINVDSTIPNLALMHISTWKKQLNIDCGFNINDPDEIYASIIFEKNKHLADGLKFIYPRAKIDIGGSGYNIKKKLPDFVDLLKPDYSLYPDMDYDLGFTTRGCNRNCYFCIVCKKEGSFKINQHPSDFHDETHKKIVLLDNNILLDKDWFLDVTDWILKKNMKVDFSQGLDIRLVDGDIAKRLEQLKPVKYWRFAFDNLDYAEDVKNGIKKLIEAGVNVREKSIWYVYLHSDDSFNDALTRCNILRDLNALPFIMVNQNAKRTQRMTDLKRWVRPWVYFKSDFENYKRGYTNELYKKDM